MMIKWTSITEYDRAVPMNYFLGLMMMVVLVFMSPPYSAAAAVEGFQFVVGGNDWVVSPTESYNHWAGRNRFSINDSILFRYKAGQDSVLVVNREDYENCNTQHPIKSYTDGNSVFVFDRSGPFYFISGAPTHCYRGQKLIVVVLAEHHHLPPSPPQTTPAPSLSPPSMSTPTHAPSQPPTHVNPPSPTPSHVSQPPTHVHPPTPTPTPSDVSQPPISHVPSLPPTDHVHPPSPSPGPSHVTQPPIYVDAPSPSSPSPKASSPPSSSLIPSASSPGTIVTPPTPPSPGQPAGPATVAPTSNRPSSANSLVGSGCVSGVVVSGMVMLLSLAIVK